MLSNKHSLQNDLVSKYREMNKSKFFSGSLINRVKLWVKQILSMVLSWRFAILFCVVLEAPGCCYFFTIRMNTKMIGKHENIFIIPAATHADTEASKKFSGLLLGIVLKPKLEQKQKQKR